MTADERPESPAPYRPTVPEANGEPLPDRPSRPDLPPLGAGADLPPFGPTPPAQAEIATRARGPARNIVLFLLTLLTTTYWGFLQYQQFYLDDMELILNPLDAPRLLFAGLPYGLAVIAFLLAHEMGHYLACRYYGIRATLPFFIPIPPIPLFVLLPGTMGAVIRILGPLSSRRALFDVAVAGPLAGFVVALPILAAGLGQSRVVELAELGPGTIEMGEPLIWGPMQDIFAPPMGAEQILLAHPLAFVGWFALLVTAMNLLPVGQLDGGHLLYAAVPRLHRLVSLSVVAFMIFAGWRFFPGWIFFAVLVFFVLGTKHPRPMRVDDSLGAARGLLLLAALLILVTSFILVPVRIDLGL